MLSDKKASSIFQLNRVGVKQQEIAKAVGVSLGTVNRVLNESTRVVVISDAHCDHVSGLTPPKWWNYRPQTVKFAEQMEESWKWYTTMMKGLKPDVLFVMGDMVDGKGKRSGGTELITGQWREQIKMGTEVITTAGAKRIVMVYGTPYHVGDDGDDYEDLILDKLTDKGYDVTLGGHEFPMVNGIQFDLKHKIGTSGIPHGRSTAIKKSRLWNILWNEREQQPSASILLRGHAHYFDYTGSHEWLGIICPALQGWGSKFGVRQCEGVVDTGLLWFDVPKRATELQDVTWNWSIPRLACQKVVPYEI